MNAGTTAVSEAEGGYDAAFFERLFAIEDRHFWFVCRNQLIQKTLRRVADDIGRTDLILEAGCGTGNVLRALSETCPEATVVGMDLWAEGLTFARVRGNRTLVQADVTHSPFSREFDVICLFDVLEHLPDDRGILSMLYRMLRPGGALIATVPARMSLWSYFDEAAHHCRRYSVEEFSAKISEAGFSVQFATEFMATIFPLVWLSRRASASAGRGTGAKVLAETDLRIVPGVNAVLRMLLSVENRWTGAGRHLPVGTSALAVAYKLGDPA